MLSSLSRLAPVLLRHLDAYAEITANDARDAASSLGASLRLALIATAAGIVAAVMLCAWVVMMTWDQPWREWVPAGLAAIFALGAYASLRSLRRRRPGESTLFARVRGEWRRDRALVERALQPRESSQEAVRATAEGEHHDGSTRTAA